MSMLQKLGCGIAAAFLAAALPGSATAAGNLDAQMEALQNEMARVKGEIDKMKAANEGGCSIEKGLKVSCENFSAEIGGRLQYDVAFYDQNKSEMGDGTELRRGRLEIKGDMFKEFGYKAEFDFAGNSVTAKDVFISYSGLKNFNNLNFKLGNHKYPAMLEGQTSDRFVTFIERSTAQLAFIDSVGDRLIGFSGQMGSDHWSATAGIYGEGVSNNTNEIDEGWTTAGRITFAPINDSKSRRVIHLGGWGAYTDQNGASSLRIRTRPETHVSDVRFVDTGTLSLAEDIARTGVEFAAVYGPAHVEAEYVAAMVDNTTSAGLSENLDFNGWYVEAGYFLTGESRAYKGKEGKFDRVSPVKKLSDGGPGAWQIVARYSSVDLKDESVRGGLERDWTLGVNWLINPYVAIRANYTWVDTSWSATGNSANTYVGQTAGNDDPQIFQMRAQIDF